MSDTEFSDDRTAALIAAADSLATARPASPHAPKQSRTRLYSAIGVGVLVLFGGFLISRGGADNDTASSSTTANAAATTKATSATTVTTAAATTTASPATTARVVAPTLPAPAVTLPPTTVAPSSPATTVASAAAPPTTTAVGAASLTAAQPLAAEQKGELLLLTGSVASEAVRKTVLDQVYTFSDKSKVRDQMFVAANSAAPSGTFNLVIRDGLQFDSDQSAINGVTATLALDSLAQIIKSRPNAKVRIEGHTDNAGDDTYNSILAGQRTASAVAYLASKGVDASKIEQVPVGEARPVGDNATAQGKRANRRLEVFITGLLT